MKSPLSPTTTRVSRPLLGRILAGVFLAASAASAQIISVNIATTGHISAGTGNSMIDGAETFGVDALGTVVGNWNNINFSTAAANFSDGSASTVGAAITVPGGYQFSGAPYINTPLNYGPAHFAATPDDPGTTLSFTNLNANFAGGYYAIVYLTGGAANTGALITDGADTFYYQTANPQALPATLSQATTTTDLGDGNAPVAQYAVFGSASAPLTADSITFRTDFLYGGFASIGGAQLVAVAVPEPSVLSVLVALSAGAFLLVRRRRA